MEAAHEKALKDLEAKMEQENKAHQDEIDRKMQELELAQ